MVVTREQALEKELRDISQALEKEKEAHTTTIQELGRTRLILQDVKRASKAERADLELMTLKCALLQQDAEGKAGKGAVHTDDKSLRGMLPDAPVHPPAKYGARSIPPPSPFDSSLPPHSGSDNHHGEPSDRLGDDIAASSTRGTKRTVDEMNSNSPDDTPAAPGALSGPVVICIRCYQQKLRCDPGEPCHNCATAVHKCKRAKCNDYEPGTCKRASCLRAHRKDEEIYKNIVRAGHVPRTDPSKPRIPKAKKPRKGDDDDDDDPRSGGSRILVGHPA